MQQILLDLTQPNIDIEITEDCEIFGIFIGKGQDFVNSNITFRHRLPNLKSRILIKAVLFDQAKFNTNCNLIIEKGAKQTDGYFKIETLIISNKAAVNITPSLEIMENDVKGGHGATVGKVNQDQLSYLLSRGLSKVDSEQLIIFGFLNELIQKINNVTIKQQFLTILENV